MAMKGLLLFCFLVLIESFARSDGAIIIHDNCTSPQPKLGRSSFPAGFIFGTAASAYQTEGAAAEGGRFPSIWDTFSEGSPERIADGSNGSTADDFYHRFKGDIGLMKEMGMDSFRFSISWSRILPRGNIRGGVNEAGLEFYNKTINTLLSEGLEPFVTLFHWDVPQALENEYGGFLSPHIVKDFRDFVDVCYKYYGDRVKYWITLNEPWTFSTSGYNYGTSAPGRCSKWLNKACEVGNSATEPYNVAHHLLLSHAAAVQLYREKYQESQNGKIGITLVSYWIEPYNPNSKADREAAEIGLDFMYGWFMNPLTNGDYPDIMRKLVGKRLPQFTNSTSMIVNGSFDFIGVNYYTARYATQYLANNSVHVSYSTDSHIDLMWEKDGKPIGEPWTGQQAMGVTMIPRIMIPRIAQDYASTGSSWLFVYPEGIRRLLVYTKEKYNNPVIYITESGVSEVNNSTLPLKKALDDGQRIYCYSSHLCKVKRAIDQDGVNVKGYFAWAFSDNYEWEAGYTVRFGLYFIDYNDNLRRYPKRSVGWFKNFLKK